MGLWIKVNNVLLLADLKCFNQSFQMVKYCCVKKNMYNKYAILKWCIYLLLFLTILKSLCPEMPKGELRVYKNLIRLVIRIVAC